MTTVNKSFTATGSSAELFVRHGEEITYDLLGTFVATAVLEYSRDGINWTPVVTGTSATSGVHEARFPDRGTAIYRWRCSAYTSGTAIARLFKNPEVAQAGSVNGTTVSVTETRGVINRTVLRCVETPISISDDAGVAQYGGVKIYTFPEGAIHTLGATVRGQFKGYASLIDTFDGDVALGTATATTGATLTGTEANILQSTAISQAVAEIAEVSAVPVATALTESGGRWFDGTSTPVEVYLNFVVDDNAAHGAGTATFTGVITITWVNLGDY